MLLKKRPNDYQYQLNNTRYYRARLRKLKWASIFDPKTDFHNVPFQDILSYNSTFVIHHGKFRWLQMLIGQTQAVVPFWYIVEDILQGSPGSRELPLLVYFNDIAIYGDSHELVLANILEAIHHFTKVGFMINLSKSQITMYLAKVLGH